MNSLKASEIAVDIEVPETTGVAVKAFKGGNATPEQQRLAYNFIVYELSGITKLSFALSGIADNVNWHNGRRFVGLLIERIAAAPMEDAPVELPPARTMTERARRRGIRHE